jgi:hypothetical protein
MPSAPRLVVKKVTASALKGTQFSQLIEAAVLDTKPNSPLRPRLDTILQTRRNLAGSVASAYYVGMLRSVGEILANPKLPPFSRNPALEPDDKHQRTRVLSRPTRVKIRENAMRVYAGQNLVTHYKMRDKLLARIPVEEKVRLESGRDRPMGWLGLHPDYMHGTGKYSHLPPSTSFWMKTRKLQQAYAMFLMATLGKLSHVDAFVSDGVTEYPTVSATSSRPRLASLRFRVGVPPLAFPSKAVEDLLRTSYMRGEALAPGIPIRPVTPRRRGKTNTIEIARYDRSGINRLALPEARRPMIARYAAAVGRLELPTLRKVLKPLA